MEEGIISKLCEEREYGVEWSVYVPGDRVLDWNSDPSEVTQAVTERKSVTKLGMLHLITTSLPTITESSGTVTW